MTRPEPPTAPWPSMRGGPANLGTARSAPERRDWPVRGFQTGGPVFSTPVIGADEQIYVGSADRCFYRLDPATGKEVWRFETDEIIDCAACITPDETVWVPSADGRLYALGPDGTERWRYDRMRDRTRATPSTIYWWEANVVQGPNGWLYAGNDDFYLYAIEPYEGVRWATPTGLHIWGAPAFADDLCFVPSFDRCLYALDQHTGHVRWRRNLGNFMASSPAVAGGLVIVGGFDHFVTAVDATSGEVLWRTKTGGPIYASAAVDGDQVLIGSADGVVYALALRTGAVRWTRWLGDAIRGSIAVGEDVYVPGGDGLLTCLSRDGGLRWQHDTRQPGTLCNLNASIALGRHGLATASASGEVIYVPYGAVPPAEPPAPEPDGTRLLVCSPGGAAGEPVGPGDTVGVRVLHTEAGTTLPGRILSANAPICPDGTQLHVRVDPGTPAHVHGSYAVGEQGSEHRFDRELEIPWVESQPGPLGEGFRAARLAVQGPSIVPSFDQIGLASLSIDIGILQREGEHVIAWGVQRFGMDAAGDAVGVPDPRILYYAFDGTWQGGTLALESGPCLFEITAFPVPLTRLRLVAHRRGDALVGGSLVAETDARSVLRALLTTPQGFRERMRSWLPDSPGPGDLWALAGIASKTLALLPALLRGLWKPWGLIDANHRFHGLGSFQAKPSPERRSTLELVEARVEKGRVVAGWRGGDAADAPGILLLKDGRPVEWPYSQKLVTKREQRVPVRTELDARGATWDEAWVLRDHERVARVER